jgi:hypothetical protein
MYLVLAGFAVHELHLVHALHLLDKHAAEVRASQVGQAEYATNSELAMLPYLHMHACSMLKPETNVGMYICPLFQAKETGQLAPTKKGVLLSGPEWAAVQAVLPQLQQAVDAGNDQFSAELPNNLRATTSTFQ